MKRATALPRKLLLAALTPVALVSVGACSNSNKATDDTLGTVATTLPGGVVVPGSTDDCQSIYVQFISALTSAYAPAGTIDFNQVFGDVTARVPADLQDEMAVLSGAYQAYAQILAANGNDRSIPEVQAAITALQTPEVIAAGTAVQQYFEATCPDAI